MSDPRLPASMMRRIDESADPDFYVQPRFVAHIDDATILALTQVYREHLPEGGRILDLMSSWISHLPEESCFEQVAGLGMNAAELEANPRLTESRVQDLNAEPLLPYEDARFDAVLIAVSVQYLIRPVEVFAEIARVLRPGGELLVAVSHRIFPTKAVAAFRSAPPDERPPIVARYAELAGGFKPATVLACSPTPNAGHFFDPLWVILARTPQPD